MQYPTFGLARYYPLALCAIAARVFRPAATHYPGTDDGAVAASLTTMRNGIGAMMQFGLLAFENLAETLALRRLATADKTNLVDLSWPTRCRVSKAVWAYQSVL